MALIYQGNKGMHQSEFDLDFESLKLNSNGIYVLLAKDVNPNVKELMDKVTIIKALYDPR
jgi:hypothetical protein